MLFTALTARAGAAAIPAWKTVYEVPINNQHLYIMGYGCYWTSSDPHFFQSFESKTCICSFPNFGKSI